MRPDTLSRCLRGATSLGRICACEGCSTGWKSGRSGRWSRTMARIFAPATGDGYEGFLALEPHLAAEGQFGGFSGADLFHQAVHALKGLLEEMRWEYS